MWTTSLLLFSSIRPERVEVFGFVAPKPLSLLRCRSAFWAGTGAKMVESATKGGILMYAKVRQHRTSIIRSEEMKTFFLPRWLSVVVFLGTPSSSYFVASLAHLIFPWHLIYRRLTVVALALIRNVT